MEVKFDLVRIGKIRKNYTSELILKQNLDLMRAAIRDLLSDEKNNSKNNSIHLTIVIPGKGHAIKIVLEKMLDSQIRKMLKENFPNSIYNGNQSVLLEYIDNKIF